MKILNYGSLNIDYTYRIPHIVAPGETITSQYLSVFPGGKGLNQSVALAKAGAQVWHAGMIGEDGEFLKQICKKSGADTRFISQVETRTGNAVIQVSDEGQNSIILFPGANRMNTKEKVDSVLDFFEPGDFLLLQNEINLIGYLIDKGKEKGMTVILNPSPFDENLKEADLKKVDLFLINEIEGRQITGKNETEEILAEMKKCYPRAGVVLTLGSEGAIYQDTQEIWRQKAYETKAIDTTAAGDTFTGYFLAAMMEGKNKAQALTEASYAAAIAVSRKGAAVSIPEKQEVIYEIANQKIV